MRIGVGNINAKVSVFIANRPPLESFQNLQHFRPLAAGEVAYIGQQTGNHWRKIFNCFAKLMCALEPQSHSDWRDYRDSQLLQSHGNEQLLFSTPQIKTEKTLHIVCGKTYFQSLNLDLSVSWLDNYFAVADKYPLIVSPYFDYRQLSNQRIEQLVELISAMR